MKRILHKIFKLYKPNSVRYKNMTLPGYHLRLCGPKFQDDEHFFKSAEMEVDRLVANFGLTNKSRILDVGCGVGRLAMGLLRKMEDITYYRGVDVKKIHIDWCKRYIEKKHLNFRFTHVNIENLRYNPTGEVANSNFKLPYKDQDFDIIYLFSVFSHMTVESVKEYLREFHRLLVPQGKIFLTAFVEDEVPEMTINPRDYGTVKWGGPLHCVLYNRMYFESLIKSNNLTIDRFDYESEKQSSFYIFKTK